ncbi:hypothetical protein CRYUN_Cryun35bG0015900 [Craigia yunnanensis]
MAIVTSQTELQLVVNTLHTSNSVAIHQIQSSSLSTIVARRIKESSTAILTKFHAGYFRVCRPTLFKRSMKRFIVAWWTYSFPLSVLALASLEYAEEVKSSIAHLLMLRLLAFSVLVSISLIIFTLLNTKMFLPDNDPIASLLSHLPSVSQHNKSTTTTSV